ncbi:hypothetical protein EWM64_g7549 [Hericium alpestre]|uniref:Uncharacterized protein n=1 Tax=Hericium alpestre TaxID=135208 RepID=A0A4Y9ZNV9_9AGAM|nr:hypothetical protein EWM64_g7549 [Hericium alpestre]
MLKALYYRDYPPAEKVQLELLAPLLRMATKYMLGSLRKELVSRLQILLPDTLDAYTSADRVNRLDGLIDAELGIDLGVTCDLPIILPAALYLSALRLQGQMHSMKRLLPPTDDTNLKPHAVRFLNNWSHLLDDIFATLDDQPFWKTLEDGRWKCLSHHACDGLPFEAKRQMETRCRRLSVNVMKQSIIKVPQTWMICGACKDNVRAYERQLRGKLWDILPAACGYTSWDALRNEQSEDNA